jgi:hypothetical protein
VVTFWALWLCLQKKQKPHTHMPHSFPPYTVWRCHPVGTLVCGLYFVHIWCFHWVLFMGSCEHSNEPMGSIKGRLFWTSWVILSFSRRTLLCGVSHYGYHSCFLSWIWISQCSLRNQISTVHSWCCVSKIDDVLCVTKESWLCWSWVILFIRRDITRTGRVCD